MSDPCPICCKDRVLVGYRHLCVPVNTNRDLESIDKMSKLPPRTSKRGRVGQATITRDLANLVVSTKSKPAKTTKAQRQPVAEQLYKQGYTMERIATQLGVTKMQISRDLVDCNTTLQSKEQLKTASNPRGSGRRKGGTKPRKPPDVTAKHEQIVNTTRRADRHSAGYMADYMRRKRAAARALKQAEGAA